MKQGEKKRPRIHAGVAMIVLLAGLAINPGCKSIDLQGEVSAKFSTDKAEYGQGETILLQLRLGNEDDDPVTLTFASSQIYDFWVRDSGGSEVWRWSASRVFAAVITNVAIMPGATVEYTDSWDQLNNHGAAVPAGAYTIHAGIVIAGAPADRPRGHHHPLNHISRDREGRESDVHADKRSVLAEPRNFDFPLRELIMNGDRRRNGG